ncbi:MAG TPA: ADP-ribosylglycohydrolase family protein [Dermatophilaceae bacterium]|nr:ADP-ribosylglycohydrolase family protein [Dermatophilaceae bacterium]
MSNHTPGATAYPLPDRTDRCRGAILGLLVGDALGVPYEFHPASTIPAYPAIEMVPPLGFHRAHAAVPPGTWSDDGAQALVLLESLLRCGRLDTDDVGAGLVAWLDRGRYAVDGRVFDVGIQTAHAVRRIRDGHTAANAGQTDVGANGNGSLMRVLPLALWHRGDDDALIDDAFAQSAVTHGHLRSKLACALYCVWARAILDGHQVSDAWAHARGTIESRYAAGSPERAELDLIVPADGQWEDSGTGYVVHSLRAALTLTGAVPRAGRSVGPVDYATVVKGAIALGDDTDTTACIAGGIAGLVVGEGGIPPRWRAALRGRELLDPLLAALTAQSSR